jgi:hypothetical protein
VSREAYENYLANNPHNESRFVFPIDEGDWQDSEDGELVAEDADVGLYQPSQPPNTHWRNWPEGGRL